jgi:hypothetical protein
MACEMDTILNNIQEEFGVPDDLRLLDIFDPSGAGDAPVPKTKKKTRSEHRKAQNRRYQQEFRTRTKERQQTVHTEHARALAELNAARAEHASLSARCSAMDKLLQVRDVALSLLEASQDAPPPVAEGSNGRVCKVEDITCTPAPVPSPGRIQKAPATALAELTTEFPQGLVRDMVATLKDLYRDVEPPCLIELVADGVGKGQCELFCASFRLLFIFSS